MNIQQLVNDKLRNEQEERKKRERSGKINPSTFGRCFRYQIWYRRNEPFSDPPTDRDLRVFATGKIFHDWVEDIVVKNGGIETEVKVETDDVLGYADIVTENSVIDLKTQHSKAFWYMNKKGFSMIDDKLPHVLQVSWYAIQLKKPMAGIVYISKDDLCIEERIFPITTQIKGLVASELVRLRGYWDRKQLPEGKPRAFPKECEKCWYRTKCKGVKDVPNKDN